MALYRPFVTYFNDGVYDDSPLFAKILAALFSGGIAITIANPTDTIKTKI